MGNHNGSKPDVQVFEVQTVFKLPVPGANKFLQVYTSSSGTKGKNPVRVGFNLVLNRLFQSSPRFNGSSTPSNKFWPQTQLSFEVHWLCL